MNMIANTVGLRAAAGAQPPITWIRLGDSRMAAMRRGQGTPVLCLHAIGHGARDFEPLAARIDGRFEIVALDWPGQGASPDDGALPSAAHYETLIGHAMDALGMERAILIGNSIGGAAALRFAAHNPGRVRALVLCDSGGLFDVTRALQWGISIFVAFFRAGEHGRWWFRPAFRVLYGRVLQRRPAHAQRKRIVAAAYEIAKPLREAWESFARPDADIRDLGTRVACPVWFAWARNGFVPWKAVKPVVPSFAKASVTLFRGRHAAFLEDPDRFADAFFRFARDL
jgi:pimeloyl-ACP methyl ester carboxylesterase